MNKHRSDHQALHEAYQHITQNEARGGMWDKMLSKVASKTGVGARAADRVQGKSDEKQMIRHFNSSVLGNMQEISKSQLTGWLKNLVKLDATKLKTINQLPDTLSSKDAMNALPGITQELRVMKQTGTGYNMNTEPTQQQETPPPLPPVEQPSDEPSTEQPPVEQPSDEPSTEQPSDEPSTEQPPVEQPSDEPQEVADEAPEEITPSDETPREIKPSDEPAPNADQEEPSRTDDWLKSANTAAKETGSPVDDVEEPEASQPAPATEPVPTSTGSNNELRAIAKKLKSGQGFDLSAEEKALINSVKSQLSANMQKNPNQNQYRIGGTRITNKQARAIVNSSTVYDMLPILEQIYTKQNILLRPGFMNNTWGRF